MRISTLATAVLGMAAISVSGVADLPAKLVFNASASAPVGFYWINDGPVEVGDLVLVRPPERVQILLETRRYLPVGVPLIKRIAAMDGDTVCRLDHRIVINGSLMAFAREWDKAGRSLPAWRRCLVLDGQQIFLLGHHPDSFDSRYFGAVDRALVIGCAVPLRLPWEQRDAK